MPENTKFKIQNSKFKFSLVRLLFWLVIIAVYFFGLNIPLVGPDEPRYAQIAREMLERADWITPKLGGFDWFEKPALLYWLEIISYKIFGVTEFAARFGSAIFGLLTIFSLWILGRFLATERAEENEKSEMFGDNISFENNVSLSKNSVFFVAQTNFADWLALIAASSIGLIVFSRAASFDIILTFPLTAALVGFYIFDARRNFGFKVQSSRFKVYFPLAGFYFFVGIALIAKGLVGIIFPFAIVGFYHVLSWKMPNKTFVFSLLWGTILSLAVAAVWYLPIYQANGWKFIDEFIIQHHFQRFTSDKYQHHQPFWFFFAVLPLMTLPWLPFFLKGIWEAFKIQNSRFKTQNSKLKFQNSNSVAPAQQNSPRLFFSPSPILLFSTAWLLVPLVFFSLSGSKLPGYILPSLPAALILTAFSAANFARKSAARAMVVKLAALAVFVVVAVVLKFFIADFVRGETVKHLIETVDERGFAAEKITCLYAASHNLEFYAAGRLLRETDGKLKTYGDFSALAKDAKTEPNRRILVLMPQKDEADLTANRIWADSEVIAENGESAIVLVTAK